MNAWTAFWRVFLLAALVVLALWLGARRGFLAFQVVVERPGNKVVQFWCTKYGMFSRRSAQNCEFSELWPCSKAA